MFFFWRKGKMNSIACPFLNKFSMSAVRQYAPQLLSIAKRCPVMAHTTVATHASMAGTPSSSTNSSTSRTASTTTANPSAASLAESMLLRLLTLWLMQKRMTFWEWCLWRWLFWDVYQSWIFWGVLQSRLKSAWVNINLCSRIRSAKQNCIFNRKMFYALLYRDATVSRLVKAYYLVKGLCESGSLAMI